MTPREATVVFQAGPLDVDIRPATSLTQLEQSTVSIESGDVGQPLGMEFEIRLEQAGIWLRAGSTGHVCDRRAGRGWSPCRCGGEALESEMRHETAASFAIEEGGAGGHRIGPRLTARVAQNGRGPAVSGPVTGTVPPLHRTNTTPADASSGKTPVPVLRRSPACFCYRHQAAVRFPLKCSRAIWLAVGKALRCFLPRRWMLKNRGFSGFATAASSGEERYPRAASSSTLRGSSST